MASLKTYAVELWKAHRVISGKLGMNIAVGPPEERVRALSTDLLVAGLCRVLFTKGLVTDAELNAVFTAIKDADLPRLTAVMQDPDNPAPDPDIGG